MRIDVHWRSSRLSAPSLMCRTANLVIALVVSDCRRRSSRAEFRAGEGAPEDHGRGWRSGNASCGTRRTAGITPRLHTPALANQLSTVRKPASRDAGRTAGLAVRRKLAQKQAARRNVALHEEHSRAALRRVDERALHITHAAPAMNVASTSSAFLLPPAEAEEPARAEESATAEEMERPKASTRNVSRAAAPEPTQTRSDGDITNEEMDYAEREALRKSSLTADVNSTATGEDAGMGTNRIVPSALGTPDTGTEEASLRVPLSVMPAPLRGSHESLERQNTRLDADGLERIEDESDLVGSHRA